MSDIAAVGTIFTVSSMTQCGSTEIKKIKRFVEIKVTFKFKSERNINKKSKQLESNNDVTY